MMSTDHSSNNLELNNISKTYGKVEVLNNLSLMVKEKELLVLLGPSGCGKTTLLRIIAGLIQADNGSVVLGGKDITREMPHKRDIGLVFQNYALFPHLNVAQNVGFGLRMRGNNKKTIATEVEAALHTVQMDGMSSRNIKQLSGGQQQRVALARALVINPSLLLLDEPLSNLDAKLRASVRVEIAQIQKKLGVTTILVTHDQVEAMTMGDRIVLMRDGVIQQIDNPVEIYARPANIFVASFIGTPTINLFKLEIGPDGARFPELDLCLPVNQISGCFSADQQSVVVENREYRLGVRPEGLILLKPEEDEDQFQMKCKVIFIESLGADTYLHLEREDKSIIVRAPTGRTDFEIGQVLNIGFSGSCLHLFSAETERRVVPN